MIAAVLSRADGAGEVLHGGFVTYTKAQKTAALGVSVDLLREHGARKRRSSEAIGGGRSQKFLRQVKRRRERCAWA